MPIPWGILSCLTTIFAASLLTFMLLEKRWTTHRTSVAMRQWARQRGLRPGNCTVLPPALVKLIGAKVLQHFCNRKISFVQIATIGSQPDRWNLLISQAPKSNSPAGLRPAHAPKSLVDLFGLTPIPTAAGTDRYIAMATNSASARGLVNSSAFGLLPPDVGLVRIDQWLVLDFSSRPFDPIEMDRMLAVSKQIKQMTP